MDLLTITPCPHEPVGLDEMKLHSRIDGTDEDAYVKTLIAAARRHVESIAWRTLMPATLELVLQAWPGEREIQLPQSPLTGVTSLTYTDSAGNVQTVSPAAYVVDTATTPGRLVLKRGQSWPSTQLVEASPIRVRFTAGYSADQLAQGSAQGAIDAARAAVPEVFRHAIKLIAAHWYENREQITVEAGVSSAVSLPLGVDALLAPERAFRW